MNIVNIVAALFMCFLSGLGQEKGQAAGSRDEEEAEGERTSPTGGGETQGDRQTQEPHRMVAGEEPTRETGGRRQIQLPSTQAHNED